MHHEVLLLTSDGEAHRVIPDTIQLTASFKVHPFTYIFIVHLSTTSSSTAGSESEKEKQSTWN